MGGIMLRIGIAAAALAVATGAWADDKIVPKTSDQIAAAFGAREAVQQISISPDGTKVAFIAPIKGPGSALLIGDLAKGGEPQIILRSSGNPDRLTDCHWATDSRLICNVYMILDTGGDGRLGFTRIVAINSDGSGLKVLSAQTNDRSLSFNQNGGDLIDWGGNGTGSAIMTRNFIPESTTGTNLASSRSGLGVELVDTVTLARKVLEEPRQNAVEYITDGQGNVRVMGIQPSRSSGDDGNKVNYLYRTADKRDWKALGTLTYASGGGYQGFNPYAVDPATNLVYGLANENGRTALYSVSLDGSLTRKLVFERPDVDISGLVRIGRRERVVGVSYVTDKRQTEFFDPGLKALRTSLAKALPGKLISFVDSSLDENKLLVFAGSDVDPGMYYVFDRRTRNLAEIVPARSDLDKVPLATVKSITYKATDGTDIPAYLTLPAGSDGKNLPTIVMPHGGPGYRDEWGFDWLSQYFAAKGYAVIQPEFRGSTGYGDTWYQKNGFQSWRTSIGDVNDAGRWLVKAGIADPKKLAIVGWSYGGYAALQSSVLDPDLFKAIVAIAPVTDLDTLRNEARNFTNFPQVDAFIGHGAWVTEGSPARNVDKIKAPVLLFHGDRDQNVGVGESRMMADRLRSGGKTVGYVEFKGLDHQLDDGDIRAQMLAKADSFLRTALGMNP